MRTKFLKPGLFAAAMLLASASQAQVQFQFKDLGTLGGPNSWATGINNVGEIVGYSRFNNFNSVTGAALWSSNTIKALDGLSGTNSYALAINDSGKIVGSADTVQPGSWDEPSHAVSWHRGSTTATDLGTLYNSFTSSSATAISSNGQVAGWSHDENTASNNVTVWQGSQMTDITPGSSYSYANGINNSGDVVGNQFWQATLWHNGETITLDGLGGFNSGANAINNAGQIVGSAQDDNWVSHAMLWQNGTTTVLGTLGGSSAGASAINNLGYIVGSSDTVADTSHATLWIGNSKVDLNNFISADAARAGWVLSNATGINDHGVIIGNAYNINTGNTHAYMLSPVPEPETYAMMIAGLGLLGFMARRRKTAA